MKSAFGPPRVDLIVEGRIVSCVPTADSPLGIVDGMMAVSRGRVTYVGPKVSMPAEEVLKVDGLVLPGLVDCHTHLVFAGRRVDEARAKFAGEDYRAISGKGGGINSTVAATRQATDETLLNLASRRLTALAAGGVTTVEAKSGYGLSVEHELRLIEISSKAAEHTGLTVAPTYLGAHAVPSGVPREDYLEEVLEKQIPEVARQGLANTCDVYCDEGAFSVEEARAILLRAKAHGMRLRAHLGQFVDLGGVEMAAELGAVSADHLEAVSDEGIAAMARAKMTAVLLPGAWRTLRQEAPNGRRFRAAGVKVAVATDFNPGTSPCVDLWLCAALAVRDAHLTMEEAILGVTAHGADVLGLSDRGRLRVGSRADFGIYDAGDPLELVYQLGGVRPGELFVAGKPWLTGKSSGSLF